jgi:hypothetical protein
MIKSELRDGDLAISGQSIGRKGVGGKILVRNELTATFSADWSAPSVVGSLLCWSRISSIVRFLYSR